MTKLLTVTFFLFVTSTVISITIPNAALAETKANQIKLHGVVNNKHGPVKLGKIEVFDASGQNIATTEINPDSSYQAGIAKNSKYPLILKAIFTNEKDGKEKELKSFLMEQKTSNADITMFTTKVVEIALKLGGLNERNVKRARIYAMMAIPGGGGGGAGGHSGHGKH